MIRERDIERYLVRRAKEEGYLVRKVSWVGSRGAPDRVVMLPGGKLVWIELKAPGVAPEPHQAREHERMRAMGQNVEVVDSYARVDTVLDCMVLL